MHLERTRKLTPRLSNSEFLFFLYTQIRKLWVIKNNQNAWITNYKNLLLQVFVFAKTFTSPTARFCDSKFSHLPCTWIGKFWVEKAQSYKKWIKAFASQASRIFKFSVFGFGYRKIQRLRVRKSQNSKYSTSPYSEKFATLWNPCDICNIFKISATFLKALEHLQHFKRLCNIFKGSATFATFLSLWNICNILKGSATFATFLKALQICDIFKSLKHL